MAVLCCSKDLISRYHKYIGNIPMSKPLSFASKVYFSNVAILIRRYYDFRLRRG
jgi:hypothetical protein